MCEKFHQLLGVGRWFPPGTPVSSTRKLISSLLFHRLDMTLAVAEALTPNKPTNLLRPLYTPTEAGTATSLKVLRLPLQLPGSGHLQTSHTPAARGAT